MPKVVRGRQGGVFLQWSSKEINARLTKEYEAAAKKNRANGERYAVVDLGFPRLLFGVWDFRRHDTVRDNGGLGGTVRYTKRASADRACATANLSASQEG